MSVSAHKPKVLRRRIRSLTTRIRKLTRWRRTRRKQLKHALAQTHGAHRVAAIRFLHANEGKHETPGRPNRAPWLDRWAREIGSWMVGEPWCGLTVWKAAKAGGVRLSPTTVGTVAIRNMAMAGTGGFKAWHPIGSGYQIKPGDVPVYGTSASGPVHTGMYLGGDHVGEGNTSPGTGGSQNNGGGLYIRRWSERRGWCLGIAEIDWSKAR